MPGLRWLRAQALLQVAFSKSVHQGSQAALGLSFSAWDMGPPPRPGRCKGLPSAPRQQLFSLVLISACIIGTSSLALLLCPPGMPTEPDLGKRGLFGYLPTAGPGLRRGGHTSVLRLRPPLSSLLHCVSMAASTEDPCLLCHIILETESHSLGHWGMVEKHREMN